MKPVLVDTDILSMFFRNNESVVSHFKKYLVRHDKINLSIITYYEVLSGLKHKGATRQLNSFLAILLLFLIFNITACQIQSRKEKPEKSYFDIDKTLLDKLTARQYPDHEMAKKALIAMGPKVNDELTALLNKKIKQNLHKDLKKANAEVSRIIEVLAETGDMKTLPQLFKLKTKDGFYVKYDALRAYETIKERERLKRLHITYKIYISKERMKTFYEKNKENLRFVSEDLKGKTHILVTPKFQDVKDKIYFLILTGHERYDNPYYCRLPKTNLKQLSIPERREIINRQGGIKKNQKKLLERGKYKEVIDIGQKTLGNFGEYPSKSKIKNVYRDDWILSHMGEAYEELGECRKAINVLLYAEEHHWCGTCERGRQMHKYPSLARCFEEIGEYDNAIIYYILMQADSQVSGKYEDDLIRYGIDINKLYRGILKPVREKRFNELSNQYEAINKVGDAGDTKAVDSLIWMLSNGNKFLRAQVAKALGKIAFREQKTKSSSNVLSLKYCCLKENKTDEKTRKKIKSALLGCLSYDDDEINSGIAEAFGYIGDKSVVPVLKRLLKSDYEILIQSSQGKNEWLEWLYPVRKAAKDSLEIYSIKSENVITERRLTRNEIIKLKNNRKYRYVDFKLYL